MKNEVKKEKKIDYVKSSRLTWIGIVISMFIPVIGQIMAIIGLLKLDEYHKNDKETFEAACKECDKVIEEAKKTVENVEEGDQE